MNDYTEEYQKRLAQLAALKGIEPDYRDIWGNLHPVSAEIIQGILVAMGCRLESLEDLEREIQAVEHREGAAVSRSVVIATLKTLPTEILFQFPIYPDREPEGLPKDLQVQLDLLEESGRTTTQLFFSDQLIFKGTSRIGETLYLKGGLPFPQGLPLGRHHILLTLRQNDYCLKQAVQVMICPEQAYLPPALAGGGKRAGLLISLAGLRSDHNWGVGDFGDLRTLVRWAVEVLHADVIGLLPLHAVANREPYNISPYYPSSRLYRNPIYLSVPDMEDYLLTPEAREIMADRETRKMLAGLKASEKVQFEKADRLKGKVLKKVFETFLENHWNPAGQETRRQIDFQVYLEREGQALEQFAVFCALTNHFEIENPDWQTWGLWPVPYQDPHSLEVKIFRNDHWPEVLFHQYLQWQVEVQLSAVQELALHSGAKIGLYHDLALGVDPWGADAWACRELTIPGIKVGAPPDDFSPQGQDWGFYPPHEDKNRQEGYQHFTLEIRQNSRPGGALRIDHILKFSRLFWILEGRLPKEGAYVKYFLEDYLKILALESVRNKTLLIGEDLGTLPEGLREVLQSHGIFSYRLFYFEKDQAGNLMSPADYPELALASVSTHDLPPLAGFWGLEDLVLRKKLGLFPGEKPFHQAMAERIRDKRRMIDRLHQLGFLSREAALTLQAQAEPVVTEDLHRAVLSFILYSRAKLVVVSQEDLFLERDQLNLPGTVDVYPNWSGKMRYSLEELWTHPEVQKKAGLFRELIDKAGRGVRGPLRGLE